MLITSDKPLKVTKATGQTKILILLAMVIKPVL